MRVALPLIVALSAAAPIFAHAGDIIEPANIGGLTLSDSSGLVIDAEHVTISPRHIHVDYILHNTGSHDLTREASFQLPAFDRSPLEAERALDGADVNNPLALKVMVDGKPQTLHTNRKNLTKDTDGMVSPVKVTRTWSQLFPANQTVTIALDYTAAAGENAVEPLSASDDDNFCMNEATRNTINKRTNGDQYQAEVKFNLPAGALPSAPVGHFTLELDKILPGNMVSVCFPGELQKVSPTHFLSEHENFTPPEQLRVLFLATSGNAVQSHDTAPKTGALSKDQAIVHAAEIIKAHHITTLKTECIDFMDGDSTAKYYEFDLHENHKAACSGDPNTWPTLFTIRVNKKSGIVSTDAYDRDPASPFQVLK